MARHPQHDTVSCSPETKRALTVAVDTVNLAAGRRICTLSGTINAMAKSHLRAYVAKMLVSAGVSVAQAEAVAAGLPQFGS